MERRRAEKEKMGCGLKKKGGCLKCSRNCAKIHGGNKPSSSSFAVPPPPSNPLSFFKIMIGDFKEVMFIPPKFACTIGGLVKQNVYLEDSNGDPWRVKISVIDGSLAFEQGWHHFVLDHSIKDGELVVFKYLGGSLFSAQIFGTSACERIHFHEKNNSINERKRNMTKLSREKFHLPKRHKTTEALEDKCNPINANSSKKERETKTAPCHLSGITVRTHVIKGVKEVPSTPKKSPCNDNSSGRPSTPFTSNYSEATCHMIDEDAKREQEADRVSPVDLCGAQCNMVNKDPLNLKTNCYDTEKDRLVRNEDTLSDHGNSSRTSHVAPIVECTKPETKNRIDSSWAIKTCPLIKEMVSAEDCPRGLKTAEKDPTRRQGENKIGKIDLTNTKLPDSQLGTKEIVGDSLSSSHSAHQKCSEDGRGSLIEPEEVVCKFLLTEDGICYIVDENLMDELGASMLTPIALLSSEKENSVCQEDKVAMPGETSFRGENTPKVPCTELMLNCTKDEKGNHMPTCKEIGKNPQDKGNSPSIISRIDDASLVGSGGCVPQSTHKDPDIMEGNSDRSGIVPDSFPKEGKKKVTSCLKGDTIEVKFENMDSIDLPSPASVSFRFSLSLHAQSWLKGSMTPPSCEVSPGRKILPEFCWSEAVLHAYCILNGRKPSNVLDGSSPFQKLPQRLPFHLGRMKNERKVVMLRDPSMRLWPVLYHESSKFAGFIGGWEDFAIANNLQQGDMCELEVVNGSESTVHVQISRV